jgi:hypothetical protein
MINTKIIFNASPGYFIKFLQLAFKHGLINFTVLVHHLNETYLE